MRRPSRTRATPRNKYKKRMQRAFRPRTVPAEPGRRWWKNESPTELATGGIKKGSQRAMTDLQALMEARPGDEPDPSVLSTLALKEALARAVDSLDPRLRWVFEAIHYRRMSHRAVARELQISKTHSHRLYVEAIERIRESL